MIKKLNTAPILALSESQYSQHFLEYSHLIFKTGPIRPILRYFEIIAIHVLQGK